MTAAMMPAPFQHVEEASQIRITIGMRIVDRVAHAGLGSEVDDGRKSMLCKQLIGDCTIGEFELHETELRMLPQDIQPQLLQRRIIVAVQIVEPDNRAAFRQELTSDVKSDETGGTRDKDRLIRHCIPLEPSFRLRHWPEPL